MVRKTEKKLVVFKTTILYSNGSCGTFKCLKNNIKKKCRDRGRTPLRFLLPPPMNTPLIRRVCIIHNKLTGNIIRLVPLFLCTLIMRYGARGTTTTRRTHNIYPIRVCTVWKRDFIIYKRHVTTHNVKLNSRVTRVCCCYKETI